MLPLLGSAIHRDVPVQPNSPLPLESLSEKLLRLLSVLGDSAVDLRVKVHRRVAEYAEGALRVEIRTPSTNAAVWSLGDRSRIIVPCDLFSR